MISTVKTFFIILLAVFIAHGIGQFSFGKHLTISNDTKGFYSPAAVSLMEGKGYAVNGAFSNRYPPGYPALLAVIYKLTGNASTSNPVYPYAIVLIQSLSCAVLYLIGACLFNPLTGIMAAILMAAYPFFMILSMTHYVWTAMPLFICIFLMGLYLFIRGTGNEKLITTALSGVIMGLSALVWPATVLSGFLLSASAVLISRSKKWEKAGVFLIAFMIPVIAWSGYVYKNIGRWEITSGTMLSVRDGLIRSDGHKLKEFKVSQNAKEEYSQGGLRNLKGVGSFYWYELKNNPLDLIKFLGFKALRPWYGTDRETNEKWVALIQIPYLCLGAVGLLSIYRKKQRVFWLFLALIVYFWLMAFMVLSILRYMMIPMALIMLCIPALILDKKESVYE